MAKYQKYSKNTLEYTEVKLTESLYLMILSYTLLLCISTVFQYISQLVYRLVIHFLHRIWFVFLPTREGKWRWKIDGDYS